MSKILKNITGSNISIVDTGVTILANAQYTIPPNDYLLWAASSNIVTEVGSGNIVVNDGSTNLNISDGTDLIKGISSRYVLGGTDGTKIGNVGDSLKTSTQVTIENQYHTSKMRVDFSEPSTSITSTSSYTQIYNYNGSGFLWGLNLCATSDALTVKLEIDSQIIFVDISCVDLKNLNLIADLTNSPGLVGGGYFLRWIGTGDFSYALPFGLKFTTNVKISVKKRTGYNNYTLTRYLISLQKDT